MSKPIISINENDILHMVYEACRRVLKEDESFKQEKIADENLGSRHYEIGFANKFYTLWYVSETKYTRTYVYIKNISFSKDKVQKLYPDVPYNEDLRGKSRTFTISLTSHMMSGERMDRFAVPHKTVTVGEEVSLKRFLVQSSGIKYTRMNKPYYSISGVDFDNPFESDIVISIFDNIELPEQGDILNVRGVIGFYNDNTDTIYLNRAVYDYVEKNSSMSHVSDDGEKIKDLPVMLAQKKHGKRDRDGYLCGKGFVVFVDEDNEKYIVESEVLDYMTAAPVIKFDMDKMNIGSQYTLSGTIKKSNGFNRVLRAKFKLVSEADPEPENVERVVKKVAVAMLCKQGKKELKREAYSFAPEHTDEFLEYVWETKEKFEGKLGFNSSYGGGVGSLEDLKKKYYEYLEHYNEVGNTYGTASIVIEIPQTKEEIIFDIKIIFES